ncbi:MAG: hypothetical protein AAFX99_23270, partial [Myxococcota bacterium]
MTERNVTEPDNTSHGQRRDTKREPRLVQMLRTMVLAFALCAFAWDITTGIGQMAIILGAMVGGHVARQLAATRWPLWRAWFVVGALGCGGVALSWLFTDSMVTSLFNPEVQLDLAEFLRYGGFSFALVAGLRTQTERVPQLIALELAVAAGCMASSLAMHRDGAINRPTVLGDWAWSQGHDPARYIIYAGCIASVAALLMLIRERSMLRTGFHLGVIAVIFAAILSVAGDVDMPDPQLASKDYNWEDKEIWLDPDMEAVWGPTRDSDPGMAHNGEGKGEGKNSDRREGDKGRQPNNEGDPFDGAEGANPYSEFDQEYMSQHSGSGSGSGSGGAGSRRP